MATVYIVQEPVKRNRDTGELIPSFNLAPAQQFGSIEFLLPPGPVMLSSAPMVHRLRQKLQHFSDEDYIVPTGDPAAITTAACIAAHFNRGQFKLLKWNNRFNSYTEVKINVYGRDFVEACS